MHEPKRCKTNKIIQSADSNWQHILQSLKYELYELVLYNGLEVLKLTGSRKRQDKTTAIRNFSEKAFVLLQRDFSTAFQSQH